ncbi:MAG: hypothetical protein ACI85S_002140, partial [Pseudohongiellaceae bacterium]
HKNNFCFAASFTEKIYNLNAIDIGHHQIEKDYLRVEGKKCFANRSAIVDIVSLATQLLDNILQNDRDIAFVINDQNSQAIRHRIPSPIGRAELSANYSTTQDLEKRIGHAGY